MSGLEEQRLQVHELRKAERAESMGLTKTKRSRSHVTVVENKVKLSKEEEALLRSMALTVEDNPWQRIQFTNKFNSLAPTYDPTALSVISYQNNTLRQCVAAMQACIDGTGYDIVRKDGAKIQQVPAPKQPKPPASITKTETISKDAKGVEHVWKAPNPAQNQQPSNNKPQDQNAGNDNTTSNAKEQPGAKSSDTGTPKMPDLSAFDKNGSDAAPEAMVDPPDVARIKAFWDEPYPGVSFQTMRFQMRDYLETTGNGYLEIIRDQGGDLALLNLMDSKLTRMIRHDDLPVAVVHEVNRSGIPGKGTKVTLLVHERRFVQIIGLNARFFKTYKATRNLNAQTGIWQNDSVEPLQAQDNATEVLHFIVERDVLTPYGIPRWVNQIPSVMGSRKAEELNVEFFESGGIPPAIILIQGGTLSAQARHGLTQYLSGQAKFKQRGVVIEIAPSGGDLNSAANVKATVEKLGDQAGDDSKFEKYDDKCTQRVRMAFRLPPLLIGLAQDYNYATAQTAIMFAEEQVFKPERRKFDEIINATIMKELDPTGMYVYKSKDMSAKFLDEQIKAMMLAKGTVDGQSFVEALNEIAGLELKFDAQQDAMNKASAAANLSNAQNQQQGGEGGNMAGTGGGSTEGSTGAESSGSGGNSSGGSGGSSFPGQVGQSAINKSSTALGDSSTAINKLDAANPVPDRMEIKLTKGGKIRKLDEVLLTDLANDWAGYLSGEKTFMATHVQAMHQLIKSMTKPMQQLFAENVAMKVIGASQDPNGVRELISCAGDVLARLEKAGGDSHEATPKVRNLYVSRVVSNAGELIAWAKNQGFETCLQPGDMHVTVCYSKDKAFDTSELKPDQNAINCTGGARSLAEFGEDHDTVVLKFVSPELNQDWQMYQDAGASHSWPSYSAHVSLTLNKPKTLDISKIIPYDGVISLGPELWGDCQKGGNSEKIEKAEQLPTRLGDQVLHLIAKSELRKSNPNHDPHTGEFTSAANADGLDELNTYEDQVANLAKSGVEVMLSTQEWEKEFGEVGPQQLVHALCGGPVEGLQISRMPDDNSEDGMAARGVKIELTGQDADMFGAKVVGFEWQVNYPVGSASLELMTMKPGSQDAGAVKAMLKSSIPVFEHMGLEKVGLFANLDAGGYAWSRYGFNADPGDGKTAIGRSLKAADDLVRDNKDSLSSTAMAEYVDYKLMAKAAMSAPDAVSLFTDLKTPTLDHELSSVLKAKVPQLKSPTLTKVAMQGTMWSGTLNLYSEAQRERFDRYVGL